MMKSRVLVEQLTVVMTGSSASAMPPNISDLFKVTQPVKEGETKLYLPTYRFSGLWTKPWNMTYIWANSLVCTIYTHRESQLDYA